MTAELLVPTNLFELHEALAKTTGPVHVHGARTAEHWAGAIENCPNTLDLTGLTGVLTHNPADMTVAVRAGTPLRELQAELASYHQRVAFDAARSEHGATVGGLIATADSGPLALAYGSLRDLMIGATVVLADGTVTRTGGHVIKNVAGYDLAKLLHGSYGNFGVLAEVVLQLHPLPPATRTVRRNCTLAEAAKHAVTILSSTLEPTRLEWVDEMLLTQVEGTVEGAGSRAERLAELINGTVLTDKEAQTVWARHTESVDAAVLRIGCRPSRLTAILNQGNRVTAGLGTGIGTLTVSSSRIEEIHELVTIYQGVSITRNRPSHQVRAWGQLPSAIHPLRALKNELDPHRRLSPGRFENWFNKDFRDDVTT